MLRTSPVRGRAPGFTLVEMMIALTVVGILLVLGVPAMRGVVENTRIRATSESLKYGLDLARNEAVRLNQEMEFAATDEGWVVRVPTADDSAPLLHSGTGRESGSEVALTFTPTDARRVTFDSFGRALAANRADASAPVTSIDVESVNGTTLTGYRPMRVQVLTGGAARLCDPAVDATDPRVCL